jgi:hypothetical protein
MSVSLDGQALFDERQLKIEPESLVRDSIERAAAGLDGVLSIDLGERCRRIIQRGTLRAASMAELNNRIAAISDFVDGDAHVLAMSDGREFGDLRMDSFNLSCERANSSGVSVDYEIVYKQLKV